MDSELGGTTGEAVWIDCLNEASTYSMSAIGSPDLLERVKIGRAFTVFQHHTLIHRLEEFIEDDTEIIVLSNFDHLYLNGQVKDWEAKELFKESWTKIKELSERKGLKVLVSSSGKSELSQMIKYDSDNSIEVETTDRGLKYSSDDYEQMLYADGDSAQTTMSYWSRKTREKVELTTKVT